MKDDSDNQAGIYAIYCLADGKGTIYIGQSAIKISKRLSDHRCRLQLGNHHNKHLQSAWNMYGPDSFEMFVVEVVSNPALLVEREQFWLDRFRAQGPVYNTGLIAETPMLGRPRPIDVRERISRAHMGKVLSLDHRRKLSEAHKGKSPSNKGKLYSEETKAALKAGQQKAIQNGVYKKSERWQKSRKHVGDLLRGRPRPRDVIDRVAAKLRGRSRPDLKGKPRPPHVIEAMRVGKLKPYPALLNTSTGETIPAGRGIISICKEHDFDPGYFKQLINGKRKIYKGWMIKG